MKNNDELISLLKDDLKRERMHLNFYLYHASAVTGLHAIELREFLIDAAKGEMEHVLAFQDRLYGLGAWANWKQNSSTLDAPQAVGIDSEWFPNFSQPEKILEYARDIEQEVVNIYTQRLDRLEDLNEHYLKVFYENQLQDSYEDCEKIRRILAGLSN